jgi:hypothetical protein
MLTDLCSILQGSKRPRYQIHSLAKYCFLEWCHLCRVSSPGRRLYMPPPGMVFSRSWALPAQTSHNAAGSITIHPWRKQWLNADAYKQHRDWMQVFPYRAKVPPRIFNWREKHVLFLVFDNPLVQYEVLNNHSEMPRSEWEMEKEHSNLIGLY